MNFIKRNKLLCLLVFLISIPFLYFGINGLYRKIDSLRFPEYSLRTTENMEFFENKGFNHLSENEKGVLIFESVIQPLENELNSSFGWSYNDILPFTNKHLMDNRANRQFGVSFTTKVLFPFISSNFSKLGRSDKENEFLTEARSQYFPYDPDSWGFIYVYSENYFNQGIKNVRKYEKLLLENSPNAVYNVKSDDIYNLLKFISGRELMDNVIGKLNNGREGTFFTADNDIAYAQGVQVVIRSVFITLINCYPQIFERGGSENIKKAIHLMDQICNYQPYFIQAAGDENLLGHNHVAVMYGYYSELDKRFEDIIESLNR